MDRVDYQTNIIQDIVNLHKRKELNLRPWYQRRIVWTTQQQSYLINTIHEQKPVPSIYVRHSIDVNSGRSIREVVDGQQRLAAVLEYVAGNFAARHPHYDRPVKFGQLTAKERHQFLTTGLSVGFLLGADDSDVIEIFGRINSSAVVRRRLGALPHRLPSPGLFVLREFAPGTMLIVEYIATMTAIVRDVAKV